MTRRPLLALGLTFAALLTACDSGPKGQGTLSATVESDEALGAVVLEFAGGTVTGFEGQGNTLVYSAALEGAEPTYRVILVSPDGAPLTFGIHVSDLAAEHPAVTAITATSTLNTQVVPSKLQIRVAG